MRKQCKCCGLETDPLYSDYPYKVRKTISVPESHIESAIHFLVEASLICDKVRIKYGTDTFPNNSQCGAYSPLAKELEEILNAQSE